jgi:hypothetical protein
MVIAPFVMTQSVLPLEVSMLSVVETPLATTSFAQLLLAKLFPVEDVPLIEM